MKKLILCLCIAVLASCSHMNSNDHPAPQRSLDDKKLLSIATGGKSGPYYAIGKEMSQIFSETGEYAANVQSSGGTAENLSLLKEEKAELAFAMLDIASLAYKGEGGFKEPAKNLRSLATLYTNVVQVVTLPKTEIKSLSDLKGKKIGIGAKGSGVEINALTILKGYGIERLDIDAEYLSYRESIEQLKSGAIDAAFVTSGLPNPAVTELLQSERIVILPIELEKLKTEGIQTDYLTDITIPKGVYQNDQDIQTVGVQNILLVSKKLPDQTVYELTKILNEKKQVLIDAHPAMSGFHEENAVYTGPIPMHPGALKFYSKKNVRQNR